MTSPRDHPDAASAYPNYFKKCNAKCITVERQLSAFWGNVVTPKLSAGVVGQRASKLQGDRHSGQCAMASNSATSAGCFRWKLTAEQFPWDAIAKRGALDVIIPRRAEGAMSRTGYGPTFWLVVAPCRQVEISGRAGRLVRENNRR